MVVLWSGTAAHQSRSARAGNPKACLPVKLTATSASSNANSRCLATMLSWYGGLELTRSSESLFSCTSAHRLQQAAFISIYTCKNSSTRQGPAQLPGISKQPQSSDNQRVFTKASQRPLFSFITTKLSVCAYKQLHAAASTLATMTVTSNSSSRDSKNSCISSHTCP